MPLEIELYLNQKERWQPRGKVIGVADLGDEEISLSTGKSS